MILGSTQNSFLISLSLLGFISPYQTSMLIGAIFTSKSMNIPLPGLVNILLPSVEYNNQFCTSKEIHQLSIVQTWSDALVSLVHKSHGIHLTNTHLHLPIKENLSLDHPYKPSPEIAALFAHLTSSPILVDNLAKKVQTLGKWVSVFVLQSLKLILLLLPQCVFLTILLMILAQLDLLLWHTLNPLSMTILLHSRFCPSIPLTLMTFAFGKARHDTTTPNGSWRSWQTSYHAKDHNDSNAKDVEEALEYCNPCAYNLFLEQKNAKTRACSQHPPTPLRNPFVNLAQPDNALESDCISHAASLLEL